MPDNSAAPPVFQVMTPDVSEEDRRDAAEAGMKERIAGPIDIGIPKGAVAKHL